MIPAIVETDLRQRYRSYEHHVHASASTAQALAAAEHAAGSRVAKLVVLQIDGELAIAVIAATDRLNVQPLEEATGARVRLAREREFAERFRPCELGAEPPLAMFGLPIWVDDKLLREETIVIPAGTHEDAAVVATGEWMWCERVRPLANLGHRAAASFEERLHPAAAGRGRGSSW